MEVIEKLLEVVGKILTLMGEKAQIECNPDGETISVDIRCEKAGQLIGRGGRVLEALQHIVQKMVGREFAGKEIESIVIDIDGYRKRREEELSQMASDIAERVSRSGESELLQPMSAWERKIVHMSVKRSQNLESQSEDSDLGRRVRIKPRGNNRKGEVREEK